MKREGHPVLPVGPVNLMTGKNEYIDDYLTYDYTFVVIQNMDTATFAMISGAQGHYFKNAEIIHLYHDQTFKRIGDRWMVLGEYTKLSDVRNRIHKNRIRGYVFK